MRILFIGDIFGEIGLKYLENNLASIKKDYKINIVIANAENTTYGKGLSKDHYQRLMKCGVQAITMGNHTYSKSEIKDYIEDANIVRPANYHVAPGKPYMNIKYNDKVITLVNLLGRVFMGNTPLDCPFQTMDKILEEVKSDYIIVDFHAEATSEKIAFLQDFKGKLTAIVGTHTHVQTADERALDNTLYISDCGMTGPLNGVIGDNADSIIQRFRTGVFEPTQVMTGPVQFNAVVLDINDSLNKIERIHLEDK